MLCAIFDASHEASIGLLHCVALNEDDLYYIFIYYEDNPGCFNYVGEKTYFSGSHHIDMVPEYVRRDMCGGICDYTRRSEAASANLQQ